MRPMSGTLFTISVSLMMSWAAAETTLLAWNLRGHDWTYASYNFRKQAVVISPSHYRRHASLAEDSAISVQ
jgi:hypothetical protein